MLDDLTFFSFLFLDFCRTVRCLAAADDSPMNSSRGANSVAWRAPRELVYETGRANFDMSDGRVPASLHSPTDAVMVVRPSSLPMDDALTEDDVESAGSFLYGSSSYSSGVEENLEGGVGTDGDGRVRCHEDMEDVLVELMDLPDHALANAFFAGFLNSIEVLRSLRVVSKRTMAVASDSCKVSEEYGWDRPNDIPAFSGNGVIPYRLSVTRLKTFSLKARWVCLPFLGGLEVSQSCGTTLILRCSYLDPG